MQEGTLALMQLAKTCAAIGRLDAARVPFISVLTDPTTGGVLASYAALGDVNLAEPNALIGFAGARVAAGTTGEALPPGFQRAEFLLEHGFVDEVVPRARLRQRLVDLLAYLQPGPVEGDIEVERNGHGNGFRPLAFLGELAENLAEGLTGEREPDDPDETRGREPSHVEARRG
jgi:acetyl-CoA carboxylase beta subunit